MFCEAFELASNNQRVQARDWLLPQLRARLAGLSAAGRAIETRAPLLPLSLDGQRLPLRHGPPALGADTAALLGELGYSAAEQAQLLADRVVGGGG